MQIVAALNCVVAVHTTLSPHNVHWSDCIRLVFGVLVIYAEAGREVIETRWEIPTSLCVEALFSSAFVGTSFSMFSLALLRSSRTRCLLCGAVREAVADADDPGMV